MQFSGITLISLTFFYRKIQDALEKHNRENFKKREVEKRKVDEATEKAKELMRVKKNEVFTLLLIVTANSLIRNGVKRQLFAFVPHFFNANISRAKIKQKGLTVDSR